MSITTSLWNRWRYGVGQAGHPDARLGVVAVDVEDRGLRRLGEVGAVLRGSGGLRRRREPQLVVDDDVDRAADPVALDERQVQRLGHDTLPGERRVAVHQDGQDREATFVPVGDLVHPGPGHALDDGVDRLEVRRVRGQADRELVCRRGW